MKVNPLLYQEIGCKKKVCPEATDLEIRALIENFAHLDTVAEIELVLEDGNVSVENPWLARVSTLS